MGYFVVFGGGGFPGKKYITKCVKKITLNIFGVPNIYLGIDKVFRGLHKKKLE